MLDVLLKENIIELMNAWRDYIIVYIKFLFYSIRASAQTQPVIDINPTCDIGKISYMYSRKELQLSFWRDYPYQICLVELKRFEVLRANDNNNRQIERKFYTLENRYIC